MNPLSRVRKLVKHLDGQEEGTSFGYPAFKVNGKTFAWFPQKAEVEPDTLAVRMTLIERDFRIQAEPNAYYFTPHYKDYPCVLARPAMLTDTALRELLESGYEFMVNEMKRAKARRKR